MRSSPTCVVSGSPYTVAVTGATGFVGSHLLHRLTKQGYAVRFLTRRSVVGLQEVPGTVAFEGDLRDEAALKLLLSDCQALVHLAYSDDGSEEELDRMVRGIGGAAVDAGLERFIHVSTAVVVGRTSQQIIDESTPCRPISRYERRKLRIEESFKETLRGRVPLTILRPSAVFGAGGRNLLKIAEDLCNDSPMMRRARLTLLRDKTLHLVAVENVVEAILFALRNNVCTSEQTFIVADNDPANNYESVVNLLSETFDMSVRPFPQVPRLDPILHLLLKMRGRSLTNPHSVFSAGKLMAAGFRPVILFPEAVRRFALSYLNQSG